MKCRCCARAGCRRGLWRCRLACWKALQRWCNLELLASSLTQWLERWVQQRTVVAWAALEASVSLSLLAIFMANPSIALQGPLSQNWGILLLLGFRVGCGVMCAWAACYRKVSRMRVYFGLLIANIVLSFFVVVPLLKTTCACKAEDHVQCSIVRDFQWWRSKADGQSQAENLVAARQGVLMPSGLLRLLRRGYLALLAPPPRRPLLGDGAAAAEEEEEDAAAPRRLEPPRWLMKFNVTDVGIRFSSLQDEGEECESFNISLEELRKGMMELQCRGLNSELLPLNVSTALDSCFEADWCGGVSAHVVPEALFKVCKYRLPMVPVLSKQDLRCLCKERCAHFVLVPEMSTGCESCPDLGLFMLKNSVALKPESPGACFVVVFTALFLLGALDIAGLPMSIVVFKFVKNHCGDNFQMEEQFHVDPRPSAAGFQDADSDDDDFTVPSRSEVNRDASMPREGQAHAGRPKSIQLAAMAEAPQQLPGAYPSHWG